ncbi:unnamed protein product [Ceutorhynchus assimilis]|uniref:Ig-like domain-containing protein n=1 Tax=Ceutorhynchus assimilis TaxID=467358 RepID=A0A9N9MYN3_9CUCU|nr:unnamed protein product [Ceutorhynchus assimilis]
MDYSLFEISLFIKILILGTSVCVKINQLIVPDLASPTTSTILDCDYSLEFPKDEGLVVKWFFNERMYPVYQWIPDVKPQELGILKGRLDLSYKASEDKYQVHRALKIVKLSPELAGNYTCSVSTFSSEDSRTKSMLVFVPEKTMELKYPPMWYRSESDSKVLCYVEDIFPKPEMKLYVNSSEIENATIKYQERNSALFDVEIFAFVPGLVDGTSILCELHVTIANYTVRKEAIYYDALISSKAATTSKNYFTILFWLLHLIKYIF